MSVAELVRRFQGRAKKVQSITILRLEPGDTLICKCPMRLPDTEKTDLYRALKTLFPKHACVVLEAGIDLEVVRPE